MSFIPKLPFPNVPNLPGVPQLVRSPLFPPSPGPILGAAAAIGALWRGLFVQNKWGIYNQPKAAPQGDAQFITDPDTGERALVVPINTPATPTKVVDPDSILDFGYRNEVDIPDFPIQNGAFANYNRVNLPYEASVRLSKGGSEQDRRNFLNQIDVLMNSLELYQIVTPERTYVDVNPVRFEVMRRGANAAYFLTEVDLFFREIRTVTAVYTRTSITTQNAQNPSAQGAQNQGTVNGEAPAVAPAISGVVTQ